MDQSIQEQMHRGVTGNVVEAARTVNEQVPGRPMPEWVRGVCPECGDDLVSNCYYVGGRGYFVFHECWASLAAEPTCNYRKVL